MNEEIMKQLQRLEKMIVDGDKATEEKLKKYIKEQGKPKAVKTTKKDGD